MIRDRQRIRDDMQGLVLDLAGHVVSRRACVDDDGLVRVNEIGACTADEIFFRKLVCIARRKTELVGARVHQSGTAMRPSNLSLRFQGGQVSPHSRNRSLHLPRQFFELDV